MLGGADKKLLHNDQQRANAAARGEGARVIAAAIARTPASRWGISRITDKIEAADEGGLLSTSPAGNAAATTARARRDPTRAAAAAARCSVKCRQLDDRGSVLRGVKDCETLREMHHKQQRRHYTPCRAVMQRPRRKFTPLAGGAAEPKAAPPMRPALMVTRNSAGRNLRRSCRFARSDANRWQHTQKLRGPQPMLNHGENWNRHVARSENAL